MRKDRVISEVFGDDSLITPSDLYNHGFKRAAVGGYRPEDVDALLYRVADVLESLIQQNREFKEKDEEQRGLLKEYREREKTLHTVLESSQKLGDTIIQAAKREAKVVLDEARLKASRLSTPAGLSHEILLLKQQRDRLRNELMSILETHRRLLDQAIPEESLALLDIPVPEGSAADGGEAEEGKAEVEPDGPGISQEEIPGMADLPKVEFTVKRPESLHGIDPVADAAWAEAFPGLVPQSVPEPAGEADLGGQEVSGPSSKRTTFEPDEDGRGEAAALPAKEPAKEPVKNLAVPLEELELFGPQAWQGPEAAEEAGPFEGEGKPESSDALLPMGEGEEDDAEGSVAQAAEDYDRIVEAAWAQAFPDRKPRISEDMSE